MARIEYIHLRLERWGMWVARGRTGGSGGGAHPMWRMAPRAGYAESHIPIDENECWKTEAAINQLDDELGLFVTRFYTGEPHGCSAAVVAQRLGRAHRLLRDIFASPHPEQNLLRGSFTP